MLKFPPILFKTKVLAPPIPGALRFFSPATALLISITPKFLVKAVPHTFKLKTPRGKESEMCGEILVIWDRMI